MTVPLFLMVEPNAVLRAQLGRALHRRGLNAVPAADAESALDLLQCLTPDALVLELVLPKMNGHQLLAQCRQQPLLREIPAIIMTALDKPQVRSLVERLGIHAFYQKPFDLSHLVMDLSLLAQSRALS